LYRLVTARLPFVAASAVELEEMHLSMPPPQASQLAPVSPELDRVIARCLEKQPERRYASVAALLADLCAVSVARAQRGRASAREPTLGGIAMYVGASPTGDGGAHESEVEAIHSARELTRGTCEAAGLAIVLTTGNGVLAAVALPSGPHRERAMG